MHAHWQERAEWHATQEAGLRGDVETLERERDEALQRVTELEALIAEALRPDARYVTAQGREARMHAILSSSPSSAGRESFTCVSSDWQYGQRMTHFQLDR